MSQIGAYARARHSSGMESEKRPPVRSLPSRFVQGQVDACVTNGGRVT